MPAPNHYLAPECKLLATELVQDQSFGVNEDWSGPVLCGPFKLPKDRGPGPGPGTGPRADQSWSGPNDLGPGPFAGPGPVPGPDPATLLRVLAIANEWYPSANPKNSVGSVTSEKFGKRSPEVPEVAEVAEKCLCGCFSTQQVFASVQFAYMALYTHQYL